MRADPAWTPRAGLLLAMALLSVGCASLTPPPGRGMSLRYMPREATGSALVDGPSEESPLALASPPEPEAPERLHRRRDSREAVTSAGPDGAEGNAWLSALSAHVAFLGAVDEVSASSRRVSRELSKFKVSYLGIAGAGNGIFVPYVEYGERQQRWIDAELATATRLATAASEVEDPDMRLALLRMAGPRLEVAMMGSLLLAVWLDFLHLADAVLTQRHYGVERLYVDMDGFQKKVEPAMTALSSLEPGQVEAAAQDMPALVGHLTGEFAALRETVRKGAENIEKVLVVKESIEALTLLSALRFSLPRLLPRAGPATLGVGFMMGSPMA